MSASSFLPGARAAGAPDGTFLNESDLCPLCPLCQGSRGPRGCPGPRGPRGPQGPQPPLSDAVDSERSDQAASSRAVKVAYEAALAAAEAIPLLSDAVDSPARDTAASSLAVNTVYTSMRIPCVTPLTLHVRLDGDDANDGLSETSAKRTLLGALAELPRYDARKNVTTIRIGPGEFNIGVFVFDRKMLCGHNQLRIYGAGQTETMLYHGQDETLIRTYNTDVRLYDLTLKGELYASEHALLALTNISVEAVRANASLLYMNRMALACMDGNLTVQGDCRNLFLTQRNGCIHFVSSTVLILKNTPQYSRAVAQAVGGTIFWEGTSQGACTGVKYKESWGGRVLTNGDPNLVIPGSVDGA